MKVAMITDTHHGVRNDAPEFLDMTEKFVSKVFLPEIKDRGIKHVVHLGDILDRRKFINFSTSYRLWHNFLSPILNEVDRLDLIFGNHDEYLKNTSEVAGPKELFRHLEDSEGWRFRMYEDPAEAQWEDGTSVLYLPWINDDNRDESLSMIRNSRSPICLGHLEVEGFDMYPGQECIEGLSPSLFDKFDVTASGHFHTRSSRGGFHYLGSHGQFTWGDYDDSRGFHVFDTETREFEFIPNPYTMFEKVHYSDSSIPALLPDLEGKHVKVIVHSRNDLSLYEDFISRIEAMNPADLKPVDDHLNADSVLEMDPIDESDDTLSIIKKSIDSYEGDKTRVESIMISLYQEALASA